MNKRINKKCPEKKRSLIFISIKNKEYLQFSTKDKRAKRHGTADKGHDVEMAT